MTTEDPNRSTDRDPTEQVEVQRYGPTPPPDAKPEWQAAPAWTSRPAPVSSPPPRRRGIAALPLVAIAVVAGALAGGLSAVAVSNMVEPPSTATDDVASSSDANNVSDVRIDESSAIIEAVGKVTPAVVTIRASGGLLGSANGTGSGFIYDADGWIVTNRHVVAEASELVVVLNDGRQFTGEVYGIDTLTDLAIVKIDATGLPVAPIGSSGRSQARPARDRHRQPARLREHGDHRCRLRPRSPDPGLRCAADQQRAAEQPDPDRCSHQPRQLGRSARQQRRPGDRRQHRGQRRRAGGRILDPDRRRQADHAAGP